MKKLFLLCSLLLTFAVMAQADDCGNHKDKGKGTPACKSGNGNDGGGNSGSPVVTNDNLNNISLKNSNTNVNTSVNILTAKSDSSSNSSASATQSQSQSQTANGGNATATGGNASNGGQSNSQVTEFRDVHQTASAIAPEAYSTAPCRVSGSGAGSSPFFGVSFSGSRVDTECEKRATAIIFAQLGQTQAAIELLCATKAAKSGDVAVCKALADFKKNGNQIAVTQPAAQQ